jgi:DNA-binding NtrC family response regulator
MKLLFVDDDETLRRVLGREVENFGWQVAGYSSGEAALAAFDGFGPQVAIVDLRMPQMDGLSLLRAMLQRSPELPVIMLTGHGAVPEAVEAMRIGAYDFLTKPVSLDVLEQTLMRALEHRELVLENRRLREYVSRDATAAKILGESKRSVELRRIAHKLASSTENVLLVGESGTGKGLVARAMHASSARAERPFVVLNCGVISDQLVERELFGHVAGLLDGSEQKRIGALEAAHQGTVFLDEIGDLTMGAQAMLLRVLQDGEVRPLGSESSCPVNLRILASTSRDLLEEVEAGRFRADLYYQLATLLLEVPALRERREDIGLLAHSFLSSRQLGVEQALELGNDAVAALSQHAWPGNLRELDNAMARLATLAEGPVVDASEVDSYVLGRLKKRQGKLPTLDLEALERLAILETLSMHAGNRRSAAAELGIAIKTLYNKMLRYGIEEREFLGS